MSIAGLTRRELELIGQVLARHATVEGALLFGSRAKGTASPSSDIDLALEGITDSLQVEAIASELDELPLPYQFDLVPLPALRSPSLREHIARVGVRIWARAPSSPQ
jgi:predicted nucleotidyltransferase